VVNAYRELTVETPLFLNTKDELNFR